MLSSRKLNLAFLSTFVVSRFAFASVLRYFSPIKTVQLLSLWLSHLSSWSSMRAALHNTRLKQLMLRFPRAEHVYGIEVDLGPGAGLVM